MTEKRKYNLRLYENDNGSQSIASFRDNEKIYNLDMEEAGELEKFTSITNIFYDIVE